MPITSPVVLVGFGSFAGTFRTFATATFATPATFGSATGGSVAKVAAIAIAVARPGRLPF